LSIILGNITYKNKLTLLLRKSTHPDPNNNLLPASESIVFFIGRIKQERKREESIDINNQLELNKNQVIMYYIENKNLP